MTTIATKLKATTEGAGGIRAAEDVTVHDAIRRAGAAAGLTATQADLFATLVDAAGTLDRCAVCQGELIGDEVAFGTCGHCGGRSRRP